MKKTIPDWTIPILFLLVSVISFGLLIPYLGFYQDDWHGIYFASTYGTKGLQQLFLYDNRPYAATYFSLAFQLLGFIPIYWHILSLTLRFLTVVVFWLFINNLWRGRTREMTIIALLFLTYPLFKQQPLAVIYSLHWVGFLLYILSMLSMVLTFRIPRLRWFFAPLSWVTSGCHLLLIEYFVGVELLRPFVLWFLFSEPVPKRLLKVLKAYLPYAIILGAFIGWRAFFLKVPTSDHSNAPLMLYALLSSPLSASLTLFIMAIQDFVAVVYSPWFNVLNPSLFAFNQPFERMVWVINILAGAGLFFILKWVWHWDIFQGIQSKQPDWVNQALILGVIATLLGPLPGWMIGEQISTQNPLWSDRLGLAAMFGASILLVAIIHKFVSSPRSQLVIFCLLISLSIGWHLRLTNDFRWAWVKQKDFYHQLLWRAPSIKPNTGILSDGELFPYMGYYPTSFALNTLYAQPKDASALPLWQFGLYKYFSDNDDLEQLKKGKVLRADKFGARFSASSLESIVINYKPQISRCLWVLQAHDKDVIELPYITRDALTLSNITRIENKSTFSKVMTAIIGEEPLLDWCYYFQKAELARSQQDWEQVLILWEKSQIAHLTPGHGFELLPFIEAFVKNEQWEQAYALTIQSYKKSEKMRVSLCGRWTVWRDASESSKARDDVLTKIESELICSKIK